MPPFDIPNIPPLIRFIKRYQFDFTGQIGVKSL